MKIVWPVGRERPRVKFGSLKVGQAFQVPDCEGVFFKTYDATSGNSRAVRLDDARVEVASWIPGDTTVYPMDVEVHVKGDAK